MKNPKHIYWIKTIVVCSVFIVSFLLGSEIPTRAASSGDVIVNEIMQNPSGDDTIREWFELFNTTVNDIDINGWRIADYGTNNHVIDNGGPLIIPAGGYLVLGNNGDYATNGGVNVNYVYNNFTLANSDDAIILYSDSSVLIDSVVYDNGYTFPDPSGASMALKDTSLDNDDGENWCTSTTTFGDGDFGTPGGANVCIEITPGDIIINEIMQNPSGDDTIREWFELFNTTVNDIDINGWRIADYGTNNHVIDNGGPLIIPAGGYLVLGNNGDYATNGGVNVNYVYNNFTLANSDDAIILYSDSSVLIDSVVYDDGYTFPDPSGASMALKDTSLDNDDGENWCTSTTTFGDGDFGTPGGANVCIEITPGDIIINEIMQNPSGDDTIREWFELFNTTVNDIDINGWRIADYGTNNHVIDNGGPLIIPAGGYLVLGNIRRLCYQWRRQRELCI